MRWLARWGGVALAALCLLQFAYLAPRLLYPDLNLDYPFVDGDSHDWIANGLLLAGFDVRPSGRPPLVPLVIAVLARISALRWFPLLNLAFYLLTLVGFYRLAARLTAAAPAFVAALLLLADASLQGLSLELMADLAAACLLLWSWFALAAAARHPRQYLVCGLLAGLSALAQLAALLALLPAVVAVALRRRADLQSPWAWGGALLWVLPAALWTLLARTALGAAGSGTLGAAAGGLPYFSLVRPHLGGLAYYLVAALSLLGLPACLLLPLGVAASLRRAAAEHLYGLGLAATLLVFFVLLYDVNAKRFLLYVLWPAAWLIAAALAWIARRSRGLALAAAALAVAAAALPLPVAGHDAGWAAVWPLPPVYLQAGMTWRGIEGSPDLDRSTLRLTRPPLGSLGAWSVAARAAAAYAARPRGERRLASSLFAGDRGALFLYREAGDAGGRYRTLTRLSNALRKRVKFVPLAFYEPYLPALDVTPLGTLSADYRVYRARLPELAASWLLVVTGGTALPHREPGAALPWTAFELDRGRDEAAAISAAVGGSLKVALLPPFPSDAASPFYLPFLLEATDLYVVESKDRASTLALIAAGRPLSPPRRIGATRVDSVEVRGWRAAVVSYP
jgi:4-amino-4-deoxy-L-arabinose transferase-like glycosyltransferase